MQRQTRFHAIVIYILVDTTVRVASYIVQGTPACRLLIQALQGCDGEYLVYGSNIRQGLEHGKVAVVFIRKLFV